MQSWCHLKSTRFILFRGVNYRFYTNLISTYFTNSGASQLCKMTIHNFLPQTMISIVIEHTERPFNLFELELLQATQLTAGHYCRMSTIHAPAAALKASTINCTAGDEHRKLRDKTHCHPPTGRALAVGMVVAFYNHQACAQAPLKAVMDIQPCLKGYG